MGTQCLWNPLVLYKDQARRRGGSGDSVEPPLKFYSSERTPFEANELTPLKQMNPPPKKKRPQLKKSSKLSFLKKKRPQFGKKFSFLKKNEPPLENLSYAPEDIIYTDLQWSVMRGVLA